MTSKKYYTYSEKEKICAIQEIKDSIIALERNVTKIHQNLKSIGREIYYLYDAMTPEEIEEFEESDSDYAPCKAGDCTYQPRKEDSQSKVYVKKKFTSKEVKPRRNLTRAVLTNLLSNS
ncbi:hypothetical protein C1645_736281 [Glomus cerebriforme]|uniref:Uncharacterized protein n=1 Tax=Glomus cerebriforme TaxID=658196 RepID=A0A397TC86_9GLOM|nr:hypothetical protein C1645_736281 [Glomus cerebriforme]